MTHECRERAIIIAHYIEALLERFAPVCCRKALAEIIDEYLPGIDIPARVLEAANTPLIIGRIPIFEIIHADDAPQWNKCLMTDKHTFREALERQCLGSLKMPVAEAHA